MGMFLKGISIITLSVLFGGCAWTESNTVLYEKKVAGNIKLFMDENMSDIDLREDENENTSNVLVSNCNQVKLNADETRIIVSSSYVYYEIVPLNNKFRQDTTRAYHIEEIDKKRYDSLAQKFRLIYNRDLHRKLN